MPGMSAKDAMEARQAEIAAKEKVLQGLPGAKEYLGSGAATGSQRAPGQIVNGYPLGQKRVNQQTGEWIIWDGAGWKPLK